MTCIPTCTGCSCCCGSTATTSSSGSEVISVIVAFFKGVYVLGKGVYLFCRYVLGPAVLIASVLLWRWFSGAAMTGRPLPSTFRHGAPAPRLPKRRFVPWLPRLYWAYWPGWQRAVVRLVATLLVVGYLLWPVATVTVVAVTNLAILAQAIRQTRRARRQAIQRTGVLRVTAQVGPPVAALTAHSCAPTWSTSSTGEAVSR